jgi:AbrB family looped-hinge helix DNA binding protein
MSKTQTSSHKIFVQKRNLINIPRDIREILNINEGDILDVSLVDNKIIIEPMKLIPSSQAYFWSDKTQRDMIEANNDVKSGNIREFNNFEEFLKDLEP